MQIHWLWKVTCEICETSLSFYFDNPKYQASLRVLIETTKRVKSSDISTK